MATKTFYLATDHHEAVQLSWGWFWKNFTVSQNGQVIGQLDGSKALQEGRTFALPNGRALRVQLTRQYVFSQGLDVLLDGRVLPGSHTDPHEQIKRGLYALLFLIVVNVGVGLLAYVPGLEVFQRLGLGFGTIITGLLYVGLAYWAKTKQSVLAFYLALGFYVVDYLAGIALAAGQGAAGDMGAYGVGSIFMRLFICGLLFGAAQGAKVLRSAGQLSELSAVD